MEPKLNCDKCGLCCTRVRDVITNNNLPLVVKELVKEFPYTWNEKGVCEKLVDNKCSVYENRPAICNIKTMYNMYYKNIMTEKEYLKQTLNSCNKLKDGFH